MDEQSDWLRMFHRRAQDGPRLVCFPHAGGSASFFFPLSKAFAERETGPAEVLAVQYPGRQDRRSEPFVETIEQLADRIAEALTGVDGQPLVLFGHSMGATLAFEVALRMPGRVTAVVVSGRAAPSVQRPGEKHLLGDEQLIREVRALAGTDAALFGDDELVRMVLPAIRSDYRAIETYRPPLGAALEVPIIALTGTEDPRVTEDEVAAWERHSIDRFELHRFRGGHFYLGHHLPAIVDLLAERLDWARPAVGVTRPRGG
ncbi:thioesterase II family protein [Sciscionella marina]|uniref:thioesterase II family protein n=1 Tax=Sciscionella marina TaxID=508770 RepID=UPI000372AD08|nr:alpha/beta fold hydrolase [Sciscionella marina]